METDRLVRKAGKTFTTWRPWLSIKPSANLAGLLALPCRIAEFSCMPPHNEEEKTVDPDELSTTNTKLLNNYFWQMVICRFNSAPNYLKPHDDNIQWNYCASLCLNLYSTCFQGACRVVYTPWVSHSTQHLACENRCFQSALVGRRCTLPPIPPSRFFSLFKFKLAHFSIH